MKQIMFCAVVMLLLMALTTGSQAVQPYTTDTNTIGLWHLDEATGTSWADSSGNALNGVGVGATPLTHPVGVLGGAAGGFTSSGGIQINDNATITNYMDPAAPGLTLEAWICWPEGASPSTGTQTIMERRGSYNFWWLGVGPFGTVGSAGQLSLAWWSAAGTFAGVSTTGYTFQPGKWYHIAAVVENDVSGGKWFVDLYITEKGGTTPFLAKTNRPTGSTTAFRTVSSTYCLIGRDISANRHFLGNIDEVRWSNKFRSPAEFLTMQHDLSPKTATLAPNFTLQFTTDSPSTPYTWEVVDESTSNVATIDSAGLLTAHSVGTCRVKCTDSASNEMYSETITVVQPTIEPASAIAGQYSYSQASAYHVMAPLTWSVIDESGGAGSVGTISESGVFYASGTGTCRIRMVDSVGNSAESGTVTVIPAGPSYPTDDYTVGLWHLDQGFGATWYDSSGNGLHASSLTPVVTHVPGRFGMAASNFVNDTPTVEALAIDNSPLFNTTAEFTAEAWVMWPTGTDPNRTSPCQGVMSRRINVNVWSLIVGQLDGTSFGVPGGLTFVWWKPDGTLDSLETGNMGFQNDTWYHLALVCEQVDADLNVKLYATPAGTTTPQLVASKTSPYPLVSTNTGLAIGVEYGGGGRLFGGIIDEVRYSSRAHSAEDFAYILGAYPGIVALPQITPDGGTYDFPQNISITCATEGATIYYTTDGSDPDQNSTAYNGIPVAVTQNMTIKARAYKAGLAASGFTIATFSIKDFGRPKAISYSDAVTIDGDLSDWADAEWATLDQNYDRDPSDIAEAYYAARWGENGNKVYLAAKVRDTQSWLTNGWTNWFGRDAVEFYIHTTGTGPVAYNATQADAQQYTMGFNFDGIPFDPTVWSCVKDGQGYPAGAFLGAGKVVFDELAQMWYHYEVAITPYHHFTLDGSDLQVSTLSAGQMIGLDVVAVSNDGTDYNYYNNNPPTPGYKGMKAENMLTGKWNDYTMFAQHVLAGQANASIAQAKQAADGAVVGISGIVSAVFTDCFYVESSERTYGIRVNKTNHGRSPGQAVTVFGRVVTLYTSERYILPASIVVDGSGDIKPLGMTNKTLGGGDYGAPPAGQLGVAGGTGTNNIGLLVTTTGRVTTKDTNWFMIDDGSGVSVKVIGAVPSGTPNVSVTGISSCEKDTEGAVQRVILATGILENAP